MKVAVVNGICKKHDAISESVLGTLKVIEDRLGAEARLFTYACDFDDIDFKKVENVCDILLDRFFLDADLIVYHFGIYYELFNALLLGNGRAPQVAVYHNITPKELLPPRDWRLIDKSLRQIANMDAADEIWAVSAFNARHLKERGIQHECVTILPLYIKSRVAAIDVPEKRSDGVRVLYVGRFVESKGITDLMRAVALARSRTKVPFSVDLVGNLTFSDALYIAKVKNLIDALELRDIVRFVGEVSDEELVAALRDADIFAIASYHEGFCVPLIEAMHARCLPIAYASGNVPDLIGAYGELVEPGDWQTFADRLVRQVEFFGAKISANGGTVMRIGQLEMPVDHYTDRLRAHLEQFTFEAFANRVHARFSRLLEHGPRSRRPRPVPVT